MSENKNSQLAEESNPNNKYKKYIKLIIYIFLILLLLSILISVYTKLREFMYTQSMQYMRTVDPHLNQENQKLVVSKKIDSANTYDLEDLIQSQQKFQKDVYTKFNELNDKINLMDSNRGERITESQNIFIDSKPKNPSNKNVNSVNSKDLNIVFNLIMDLNTNKPFLTDLDALSNSSLLENNLSDIKILYEVSAKGIPTSYDLATTFEDLQPNIKREIYSLGKDWLNRLKYYLSFFVVIQKENILPYNYNTLDNNLNKIKEMLIENKPEYALKIVDENNLSQLRVLNNWYKDLTYRVKANTLILKLKQYF